MTSLTKRQKEGALIVLASLFLLAIVAYSYFMLYAPARDAREQAENLLRSEREVYMALENQLKETPEGDRVPTSELQQRVAIEPLTDLILLQIEQAELISGTTVKSVTFSEGPFELLQPVEGVENLQEVLTSIQVDALDYPSLNAFLTEIEAMKRIMIIDSIDFTGPEELTQADQEADVITVNLNFSAFYRPDLVALSDTLPKVDAPAPVRKTNPLAQNDGLEYAEEEEEETPVADIDVNVNIDPDDAAAATSPNPNVAGARTAIIHEVQPNETLYSIAQKYYGSQDGEKLIREANSIRGWTIYAGENLIIPERP